MKKLLALVLALVMVLGLSVSAFAVTAITLTKEPDSSSSNLIKVYALEENTYRGVGGTYYFVVENAENYKSLAVEATGCVAAEIVKYDPEVYAPIDGTDGSLNYEKLYYSVVKVEAQKDDVVVEGYGNTTYLVAKAQAEALNDDNKDKTVKYVVKASVEVKLVKVTLEDNYTASYKKGTVKVTGTGLKDVTTGKYDSKTYTKTLTVISDVCIFGYEDVKKAAEYELALDASYTGYSDYETESTGYKTPDQSAVLKDYDPTVVCTTAFRAIEGEDLIYDAGELNEVTTHHDAVYGTHHGHRYTIKAAYDETVLSYIPSGFTVTIKDVAAGQKGVNFEFGANEAYVDSNDNGDYDAATEKLTSYNFGFYGNQVIESDFAIEVNLDKTWFEARELAKEKLEEQDIITYYLLKDGKLRGEIVVDYGKETITINDGEPEEIDVKKDNISFTINGKAGETLGQYSITLNAPAVEEAEENPNTGAESVVSVVSALAVVAVASAAAISLRK